MTAVTRDALRGLAAIACLAGALLAGCGGGGDQPSEGADAAIKVAEPEKVKLWFTSGEQFRRVERGSLRARAQPEPAIEALLAGPSAGEQAGEAPARTQIPPGTSLEGVELAGDGAAVVRLSPEFLAGIPAQPGARNRAQAAELDARLAQVTYTATQFDQVSSAKVSAGGVVVDPEVDRRDYAAPALGPKPVVKPRGPKLPGTRRLQARLAKLGYLPRSAVDGLAGYQTQQAVIAFQAWSGLERDGVVGPATSAALRVARRPKPQAGGQPRRIEVHRERGVALLIVGGRTIRAIHVSAGGPGTPTPSGRYSVFRKELQSWSVPFQTWLPLASYFNQGIAFHEYPDVPPYPASHGCVRVPAPEARGVYDFAVVGTAVVVI